jgi:starch phosphorylase
VEILEEVGDKNIFIFGMKADEVDQRRRSYNPWDVYHNDDEIRRAFELIEKDFFSLLEPGIFKPLVQSLLGGGDHYMLLADMRDYLQTQERVDAAYRDIEAWDRMAILNVARAGKFSSDRTIKEYASEIWHIEPCNGVKLGTDD